MPALNNYLKCWLCTVCELSWPGDIEWTLRYSSEAEACSSVQCLLLTLLVESSHYPNIYCLWFDCTGNQTQVYYFCGLRSLILFYVKKRMKGIRIETYL